jgi:hypothetical protein
MLKRYVIEREILAVGSLPERQIRETSAVSNEALAKLAPRVQWVQSYVAADKTFCLYLAESEEAIREHSRLSGIPATKITEIKRAIDPTTANG